MMAFDAPNTKPVRMTRLIHDHRGLELRGLKSARAKIRRLELKKLPL